jgi:Uma2 family endonuclease
MANQGRPRRKLVRYPTSDGKPMAETDFHRDQMVYLIQALKWHLRGRTAYVSGNNFLYFVEGNPRIRVSPDVYVVFGVTPELRDCYQSWKEGGRLPSVAFEITSARTRGADTCVKYRLYEAMRVSEYFLFDPRDHYLEPALQGFRLVNGAYIPIEPSGGRLHSEQLSLDLVQEGWRFRLWDPHAQEWLLSHAELCALRRTNSRQAEEHVAARAEQRCADSERWWAEMNAKLASLRAEIAALRGGSPIN